TEYPPKKIDPYKVEVSGLQYGTKFDVTMQQPSARVELPEGERIPAPSAALRKEVNREFNKKLAANVGMAVQEKTLLTATSDVDSPKQTMVVEKQETLPTNAPVTIKGTARDSFGRSVLTTHATVEGLPTVVEKKTQGEYVTMTRRTSTTVAPYEPWAKM